MNIEINQKTFKQSVKRVKNHLDKKDITIQHSALLEAMSVFVGYENWNTLSAVLEKKNIFTHSITDICYFILSEKHREHSPWEKRGLAMLEAMIEAICFLNKEKRLDIKEIHVIKDVILDNIMSIINSKENGKIELFLQNKKYCIDNVSIPKEIIGKCKDCLILDTHSMEDIRTQHGFNILGIIEVVGESRKYFFKS